jgi:(S)-2-hydroxyglutarate dehydrogenase
VIIGAGILGVSTAFWLSELYDTSIGVVEKEDTIAKHTSSRNTGVIHRPFYLNPKKKRVFAFSAQKSYFLWQKFASKYGLLWKQHGTIEVAIDDSSLPSLDQYRGYAIENGMVEGKDFEILDSAEVKELEPQVSCSGAIYSKTDTSVDYGEFSRTVFELAKKNGVQFVGETRIETIKEKKEGGGLELLSSDKKVIECNLLINAAGGGAIDIAHKLEIAKDYTDLHFRGEYWYVDEPFASKISRNIYSIAKFKEFPFLDPHFVVRANGKREIGPNAVLVSGPGAYKGLSEGGLQVLGKIFERPTTPKFKLFTNTKFLSLVWHEWQSSISKKAMCARVKQFIPNIDVSMLSKRGLAGVRTSLIDKDGSFVPEALLVEGPQSFHILNYSSPGATGAPAFSAYVVKKLSDGGHLAGAVRDRSSRPNDSLWNFENTVEGF